MRDHRASRSVEFCSMEVDAPSSSDVASLLPQHEQLLTASGIAPAVAAARGYRSVTRKSELEALGFGPAQRQVPALVIPIWNVAGELATHQARPDRPRHVKDKAVKYETPTGARMTLDVPPAARP